jgi:PH domain
VSPLFFRNYLTFLNIVFVSVAGLYVPDKFAPMLFCSYAYKRGELLKEFASKLWTIMFASQNQVLKSGSLYKKAQRTKRWIKHWFVLKNDALSWYNSSSVRHNALESKLKYSHVTTRTHTSLMELSISDMLYPVILLMRKKSISGLIRRV